MGLKMGMIWNLLWLLRPEPTHTSRRHSRRFSDLKILSRIDVQRRHNVDVVGFEDVEYDFVQVVFSGVEYVGSERAEVVMVHLSRLDIWSNALKR